VFNLRFTWTIRKDKDCNGMEMEGGPYFHWKQSRRKVEGGEERGVSRSVSSEI
jgi:hypothetical protein